MAQFPSTTAADGIWTLKKVRRAILGDNWPALVTPDDFFKNTVLLLQADDFADGSQNNTFLDSSTNAHTITRNGNVTQGSFSPFSQDEGKWGNYFDAGDELTAANDAGYSFGSGDFTVEMWVNTTDNTVVMMSHATSSGATNTNWALALVSNVFQLALSNGSSYFAVLNGTTAINDGAWHHLAAVRNGTSIKIYVDGVEEASATSSTAIASTSRPLRVASNAASFYEGYISNARIVKGTAVYTSAFTPSTTPLTAITNTSLLTCQSNRFVDNSSNAHAITVTGAPEVTPFSPFAPSTAYDPATKGGSGYFDASGNYLTTPNSSAFSFGADFTVECWVYQTERGNNGVVAEIENYQNGVMIRLGTEGGIYDAIFVNNTLIVRPVQYIDLNTWAHIAVVRSGTTVTVYIDGVSRATATISGTVNSTSGETRLGAPLHTTATAQPFFGYITNFRIVKGTAVYTSAFTPPTAPVSAVSGTSLLCNFTNAGIYDGTGRNVLETVGNAQVDTAVAKYGTGSMQFDGTGDYLYSSPNSTFDLDAENFTAEFWFNSNDISVLQTAISFIDGGGGWVIRLNASKIAFLPYIGGSFQFILGDITTLSSDTWYHIAVTRDGNDFKLFINGTLEDSETNSVTLPSGKKLNVGRWNGYDSRDFNGHIDDLRITKGVARYTANFTPPAAKLEQQ